MRKILISTLCALSLFAMPQDGDHSPEQIAKNIEVEISAHLPKKLNESTTFKNVKAFGNKLTYSYELHDTASVEFSKFSWQKIDEIKQSSHESIMKAVCESEDRRGVLNAGVVMEYRYTLPDGKFFYQFSVSKDDCQKAGM